MPMRFWEITCSGFEINSINAGVSGGDPVNSGTNRSDGVYNNTKGPCMPGNSQESFSWMIRQVYGRDQKTTECYGICG